MIQGLKAAIYYVEDVNKAKENGDVKVASVIDPFGNVFGMIENHHIPSKVHECIKKEPGSF